MDAVKEVAAVCGSILYIVSKIEKEDWFNVSVEYKKEATILRSKLSFYEEEVRVNQQPMESTMMKTLQKAESALKRAEARLNKLEKRLDGNQFWWLYAKVNLTLFPKRLGKTLQKVNQELSISENIKEEVEVSRLMRETDRIRAVEFSLLREAGRIRAMPTVIRNNDNKYVAIEKSQSAVIKAIEDSQSGARMILLHGGVGKGKSTLARYICERYGPLGEKNNVFDHVISVSCGNSSISNLATKQYEILEHLSPASFAEESMSKSGENIGSKSRIAKALHNVFAGQKILMILDGVSDKQFLYEMWKATTDGKDYKILITSQMSNLCEDFKDASVLITMDEASEEEARNILASLVGLESNKFPENIQKYADKMIQATDKNPLALACLASTFSYKEDKTNKRAWRDAWKELSELLDPKATTIVLDDENATPRSLWGAMTLCLNSLETRDAKRILFLMYACRAESVPEEVLRLFCAGMKMSSSSFTRSTDELWRRELLKRKADTLASKMNVGKEENEDSPAWSLQSLVKLYIERHVVGKQEVRDVIGALLGDDSFSPDSSIRCKLQAAESELVSNEIIEIVESDEMRVRITLCALYFDGCHTDPVVTRAMTKASEIANLVDSDDPMKDLRRKAIEPLIWLLGKPEEEEQWTEMDKCRVRKVLLNFICNRRLDNDNITYLLKVGACPSVQLATLAVIMHISVIEDTPLLNEHTITFLETVVDLLNLEGVQSSVQEAASKTLRDVCWKASYDNTAILVGNTSGVLDVLLHSLTLPDWESDAFAENAALALSGLAFSKEIQIQRVIVNKEGLLASLVNCLCQQSKPTIQKAAAHALTNLTCSTDDALNLRVASVEGVLVGLVNCLSQNDPRGLQEAAAGALANIAGSTDNALKLRVASAEGAVVSLVNCLSQNDHRLQEAAAGALANIAGSTDNALKLRVASAEGTLVGLVNCLSQNDHRLQEAAAGALANIAGSTDNALKLRVASAEGALVGLVNCLSQNDHRGLQEAAAGALANIAGSTKNALKLRVASAEGALVGLVNCLSQNDHRGLQEQAAGALANIAGSTDNALKLRVASAEGALVGLVNCLSQNDHRGLREQATRALANIAGSTDNALKLRVASAEGALVGLVNCLSQNDPRGLQEAAAGALANIAGSTDNALKLRVASAEGALVGLVNCLSQNDHLDLEREAARMASNLARASEAKVILKRTQGLLEGLTSLVGDDVPPDTRYVAVEALFKIDPTLAKRVGLLSRQLDAYTLSNEDEEFQHPGALSAVGANPTDASLRLPRRPSVAESRDIYLWVVPRSRHTDLGTNHSSNIFEPLTRPASLPQVKAVTPRSNEPPPDTSLRGLMSIPSGSFDPRTNNFNGITREELRFSSSFNGLNSVLRRPAEDEVQGMETRNKERLEEFVTEVNTSGESGYFVSKAWLFGLDEHGSEEVMSVLGRNRYIEIYETDTTVFYERMEETMQVLSLCDDPSPTPGQDDYCLKSATNQDEPSEDTGGLGKVEQIELSGSEPQWSEQETSHIPKSIEGDMVESDLSTLPFQIQKLAPLVLQTYEGSRRESPRSVAEREGKPQTTYDERLNSLKKAVKYSSQSNYSVSNKWFSTLNADQVEDLNSSLSEAGFSYISKTSTTIHLERMQGHIQKSPTTDQRETTSTSHNGSVLSDGESTSAYQGSSQGIGDNYFHPQGLKMNGKDSSFVTSEMEASSKIDAKCVCPPQVLIVSFTSRSPSLAGPSLQGGSFRKRSTRHPTGDCFVTAPKKRKGHIISTRVDKDILMRAVKFSERVGYTEDIVGLNVSAETQLKCCLRRDYDDKMVHIDFLEIRGELKLKESINNKTNALVLRSVRANVDACINNSEEESDFDVIRLQLKEDNWTRAPFRRVLESYQPSADKRQSKIRTEDRPEDLTWLALSGKHPKNSETISKTLELQCHVHRRLQDDVNKCSNGALGLHFVEGPSVTFAGDIYADFEQNSFVELNLRYEVEISFSEPCDPLPPADQPYVRGRRINQVVDFDCIVQLRTQNLKRD